jgi:hypothetical protein
MVIDQKVVDKQIDRANYFSLMYLCGHEKENSGSAGHRLSPLEN